MKALALTQYGPDVAFQPVEIDPLLSRQAMWFCALPRPV